MHRAATYIRPESANKAVTGAESRASLRKAVREVTKTRTGTVVIAADETRQSRDWVYDGK